MILRSSFIYFLVFLTVSAFSQPSISRVEPSNWWTGMKLNKIEIMVYGPEIANLDPSIDYPGLALEKIIKVENPNYVFLEVLIDESAKPGKVQINFEDQGKLRLSHNWELWEREKAAEDYLGFDNTDVMYLITPDRFANGDPGNDMVAGMLEKPDRAFKGGRHGGDIAGLENSLDYLADMGFTAVWLNPVLENNMEKYSYHGYSTTDYYKIDPRFGTNESYRAFSKKAEEKGIKLIMDIIVNHCGSLHWWMDDLPTKDWLNTWDTMTYTNHLKSSIQDPYVAAVDKKQFVDGWFVSTMPDLNQRNRLMANYLTQMCIWWIEYANLAGIRMDTYPYPDMDYMAEWTEKIMEEYPNFNIVGEEWNEDPAIVAYWQRGKENPNGYSSELKSLMDFPLQMALRDALKEPETWGKGLTKLYTTLAKDFLYAAPNDLVVFPDNHDMARFYAQMGEDVNLLKMGLAYVLTTRGVPQLYYGTEVLMAGPPMRDDGLIRSDFPGGWEGDAVNGFTGEGLSEAQKDMQNWLKRLLNWRKTKGAIHSGKLMHFSPQDGVYVYFRYDENSKIMVILNKNEEDYNLELDRFEEILDTKRLGQEVMTGQTIQLVGSIPLNPKSPMIIELR